MKRLFLYAVFAFSSFPLLSSAQVKTKEKKLPVFNAASRPKNLSDSALLDLVQQQTFRYFWDFAHPVSGLARERSTSGDIVTTGGSGFGLMAIIVGVERGFITRQEAVTRWQKTVGFLKNNAQRYH